MKKLVVVLFLALIIAAVCGSQVHAAFITDITEFKLDNDPGTPATFFLDTFSDDIEPPSGSYDVEGTFGSGRESGGSLALDSDDGFVDVDGKLLAAAVSDLTHFFSTGSGGYITGTFDFDGGLPPDSFFGIEILNFASAGGEIAGEPTTDDAAWMGVSFDASTGQLSGFWGDESGFGPLGFVDLGVVGVDTTIGLKLEIDSVTDEVTAYFDYKGSGFITHAGSTDFTELGFDTFTGSIADIYTGGFVAGEGLAVPEPATVALLGIGLAGFAGAAVRRRQKKAKQQ